MTDEVTILSKEEYIEELMDKYKYSDAHIIPTDLSTDDLIGNVLFAQIIDVEDLSLIDAAKNNPRIIIRNTPELRNNFYDRWDLFGPRAYTQDIGDRKREIYFKQKKRRARLNKHIIHDTLMMIYHYEFKTGVKLASDIQRKICYYLTK